MTSEWGGAEVAFRRAIYGAGRNLLATRQTETGSSLRRLANEDGNSLVD